MGRYGLLAAPAAAGDGLAQRLKTFLLDRWPGRIFVGALAVFVLDLLVLPLFGGLRTLDRVLLVVFGAWFLFRFGRFLLHKFLWRIRRKLILSYLFIAVVPLVLLTALFLLAGILFSGLVGSYMVSMELEGVTRELQGAARAGLVDLPLDSPERRATLDRRLSAVRALHPDLGYLLARQDRVLETSGDLPKSLPVWLQPPGFGGLVKGSHGDVLRAVSMEKDAFLLVEIPLDPHVFTDFERRTGIHFLTMGGSVEHAGGGIEIHIDDEPKKEVDHEIKHVPLVALPERTIWETGAKETRPLTFDYQPYELIRHLSTGSLNLGDLVVKAFSLVAVVFLVVYGFALLVGFFLARSITRSIHALSVGTEHLRLGDFEYRIPTRSRDQLGELAESFNTMSRGIRDLLTQQAEKERLEEELRIARQIQMSLLPPQGAVGLPGLRIAALCLPAAEVGGDYYDLLPLSETRMGVLVADVSGKGTSAALYMAELKGLVLSLSRIYQSPAKLLAEANRILAATLDSRSFITMTYALVDTAARTMRYARAGHNPIIHLEAGTGLTRVLTPQGIGLGIDRGEKFDEVLEEAEVPLTSGDVFLFFTDGLSEAMNVQSELFGERRLRDIIEASDGLESEPLKEKILSEIRDFVGDAAQHDDMTMVILKVV
jgi:sigma-B regulation protein RsbU (phosphoserine phosphatase)